MVFPGLNFQTSGLIINNFGFSVSLPDTIFCVLKIFNPPFKESTFNIKNIHFLPDFKTISRAQYCL